MSIPPRAAGERPPPLDDSAAPLLSAGTIALHRRLAAADREPQRTLAGLQLDWCERERELHVAEVAGDAEAVAAATLARYAARGRLSADQEHIGNGHLSGLAHALDRLPAELADLLARVFAHPAVRAALVPMLEAVLAPTIIWIRGEQGDLSDRIAALEAVVAGEGAFA